MKKYLLVLSCIAMLASCKNQPDNQGSKNVEVNQSAVISKDVSIKGMTCTECEKSIKTGVSEIPGVVEITASFKDGKATVRYDSTLTNLENISRVIGKRGYEVTGYIPSDSE